MIKQFVVGCSKTVNLGNYQSIRVEASLTIEVVEGDDYRALRTKAQAELKALLDETYRSQMQKGPEQQT